jgi:hypothetical protein
MTANEKPPINEPITALIMVDLLYKSFVCVEEVDTGKECEYVGDIGDGNDVNVCGDDCDGCGDGVKLSVHTYSSLLLMSSNKISLSNL